MCKLEKLKENLERDLPPIIARKDVKRYTGGLYSPKTLANEDCQGTGVPNLIKLKGGHRGSVAYLKADFIEWFLNKVDIQKIT